METIIVEIYKLRLKLFIQFIESNYGQTELAFLYFIYLTMITFEKCIRRNKARSIVTNGISIDNSDIDRVHDGNELQNNSKFLYICIYPFTHIWVNSARIVPLLSEHKNAYISTSTQRTLIVFFNTP